MIDFSKLGLAIQNFGRAKILFSLLLMVLLVGGIGCIGVKSFEFGFNSNLRISDGPFINY
ncbi:MAG: hypothetical protein ACQETE_09980 [Bacteroidota bacterium]